MYITQYSDNGSIEWEEFIKAMANGWGSRVRMHNEILISSVSSVTASLPTH